VRFPGATHGSYRVQRTGTGGSSTGRNNGDCSDVACYVSFAAARCLQHRTPEAGGENAGDNASAHRGFEIARESYSPAPIIRMGIVGTEKPFSGSTVIANALASTPVGSGGLIQPRRLIHSYSDIPCLKLEELVASKLKALLQRRHSPDLYDFVHAVFFQKALNIWRREVLSTFLKQTIYEPEPMVARNLLLELPFQAITGILERIPRMPEIVSIQLQRRRGLVQDRHRRNIFTCRAALCLCRHRRQVGAELFPVRVQERYYGSGSASSVVAICL